MAGNYNVKEELEKITAGLSGLTRVLDGEAWNLSPEIQSRLSRFSEAVLEQNLTMNLTAITDGDEFLIKHLQDSLSLLEIAEKYDLDQAGEERSLRFLDIGSGPGFPGLPLAIMRPDWEIVLLDSLKKRVDFLNRVIEDLGLKNVKAIHSRAEDLGRQKNYREAFDLVTARAVASLPVLLELTLPLVKINGSFLAMKGSDDEVEKAAKACQILGGFYEGVVDLALPEDMGQRNILLYKKVKASPKAYPRKAGTPNKKPLI